MGLSAAALTHEHEEHLWRTSMLLLDHPAFYSLTLYYPSFKNKLYSKPYFIFIIKKIVVCVCLCATVYVSRLEDNLELVLTFKHINLEE